MPSPHLAVLLIDEFADWEPALLTAALRTHFSGRVSFVTPGGTPVTSMGGMRVAADGPLEDLRARDFDGLALVGSPQWDGPKAPYIGAVLAEARREGKVIGAICGATLPVARSGMLNELRHTSNSLDYLQQNAGNYRGARLYADTAGAVSDGGVVTAPGSAPVTFASAILEGLLPDQRPAIAAFSALCAKEHATSWERAIHRENAA